MEDGGTSADLSAPHSDPCDETVGSLRPDVIVPALKNMVHESLDSNYYLFSEFFAGTGVLTSAVAAADVPVRPPDDRATGGADFEHIGAVDGLRDELGSLLSSGVCLMVHFAPPCSTFSRARGRSSATRLRSAEFPHGLPKRAWECQSANLVARHTLNLAEWLAKKGAAVSMENPESSWLWKFLDFDADLEPVDVTFSACLFGAPYQKPTRLRCWNWVPPSLLGKKCSLSGDDFSCGRTREAPHTTLEFGSHSTADAAEYVPGLCTAWASDVRDFFSDSPAYLAARREVLEITDGIVKRRSFGPDYSRAAYGRRSRLLGGMPPSSRPR